MNKSHQEFEHSSCNIIIWRNKNNATICVYIERRKDIFCLLFDKEKLGDVIATETPDLAIMLIGEKVGIQAPVMANDERA